MRDVSHRRRIELEDNSKVDASDRGTESLPRYHLFQKDRGNTASPARILSPNLTRRPLPCLLIPSFFYGMSVTIVALHTMLSQPDMQNAARATYIHTYMLTVIGVFFVYGNALTHACMSYTMIKSVLLLWTPSLNDRS